MYNKGVILSAGLISSAQNQHTLFFRPNLTHNFSKYAGKGMTAGRKKFLELSIGTDLGKKQKLKV
jgi:hypothetical protein